MADATDTSGDIPYEQRETKQLLKQLNDLDIYVSPQDEDNRARLIKKLRGWDIRVLKPPGGGPVLRLKSDSDRLRGSLIRRDGNKIVLENAIATDITQEVNKKIDDVWYRFIKAHHVFIVDGPTTQLEEDQEGEEWNPDYSWQEVGFNPVQQYEKWTMDNLRTALTTAGIGFKSSTLKQNLISDHVPTLKKRDESDFDDALKKYRKGLKRKRGKSKDGNSKKRKTGNDDDNANGDDQEEQED
ncbi:hypothetical protein F5884DRAFT_803249 [Xylogone sp. PMI_703]|nr:hypothetical protein F5884DRAFT_803249 [Xylogone sp. PMI_703]